MYHHGAVAEEDLSKMENESIVALIRYTGDADKHLTAYLMERNEGFIYNLYKPYRPFIAQSDLPGIAFIAICQAITAYQDGRGNFLSVLSYTLRTELQEAVSQSFLIRVRPSDMGVMRRYVEAVGQAERDGIEASDDFIMETAKLDSEEILQAKRAYSARNPSYLDTPISTDQDGTEYTLGDITPDDTASCFAEDVERKADSDALRDVFASMVREMPQDMQDVIMYRLLGATVSQIAKIMHCEPKDIRRLNRQAEKRLSMPGNRSRLEKFLETENVFWGTGEASFRYSFTSSPERIVTRLDNE